MFCWSTGCRWGRAHALGQNLQPVGQHMVVLQFNSNTIGSSSVQQSQGNHTIPPCQQEPNRRPSAVHKTAQAFARPKLSAVLSASSLDPVLVRQQQAHRDSTHICQRTVQSIRRQYGQKFTCVRIRTLATQPRPPSEAPGPSLESQQDGRETEGSV